MTVTACQLLCLAQVPKQAGRHILLLLPRHRKNSPLTFQHCSPLWRADFFNFSPKNSLQWQKTRPASARGESKANTQVGLTEIRMYDSRMLINPIQWEIISILNYFQEKFLLYNAKPKEDSVDLYLLRKFRL